MSTTEERIAPIIKQAYGDSPMARALILHLTNRIYHDDWDSRGREYGIMLTCWDWYAGGGTAEGVAKKIEAALS